MSNFTDTYEMIPQTTEDGLDFFFLSDGKKDIVKVVRYTYVMNYLGIDLFNLAFGDYHRVHGEFVDDKVSNNGDHYGVYHTVLSTIPCFFDKFKYAMLMVRGSDSTANFQTRCRLSCARECPAGICKKAHRRISIYRQYAEKHFDRLTWEYNLFGSSTNFGNQLIIEGYWPGKPYLTILFKKRNFTL